MCKKKIMLITEMGDMKKKRVCTDYYLWQVMKSSH